MHSVLSLVNAKNWSWGITQDILAGQLARRDYDIVKVLRRPKVQIAMERAGVEAFVTLPAIPVDPGLTAHFDITLLQNIDALKLIDETHRAKAVVRMGGMLIDQQRSADRYDKEIAQAGAVIATNKELYAIALTVNRQTYLVANGVDLNIFKPRKNKQPGNPFVIGFVGNVTGPGMQYKGYSLLAKAAAMLGEDYQLKTLLHAYNQIEHAGMPDYYAGIDCLVLPSRGEGCSNTIAEALACGVPVIITPVGYHGEMLMDGLEGLLIERDADSIVEAVQKLQGDPKLWRRLSANGRAFAEAHHDINTIAGKYDEIFRHIIRSTNNGQ